MALPLALSLDIPDIVPGPGPSPVLDPGLVPDSGPGPGPRYCVWPWRWAHPPALTLSPTLTPGPYFSTENEDLSN